MDTQNFDKMTKNEYMHTPYVVILYKYLQSWKTSHDGKPPQNYKEKREFKDIIKKSKFKRSLLFWDNAHPMADLWETSLEISEESLKALA